MQSGVWLTAPIFAAARAWWSSNSGRDALQGSAHHTDDLAGSLGRSASLELKETFGEDLRSQPAYRQRQPTEAEHDDHRNALDGKALQRTPVYGSRAVSQDQSCVRTDLRTVRQILRHFEARGAIRQAILAAAGPWVFQRPNCAAMLPSSGSQEAQWCS